jgi:hypothetical protein
MGSAAGVYVNLYLFKADAVALESVEAFLDSNHQSLKIKIARTLQPHPH